MLSCLAHEVSFLFSVFWFRTFSKLQTCSERKFACLRSQSVFTLQHFPLENSLKSVQAETREPYVRFSDQKPDSHEIFLNQPPKGKRNAQNSVAFVRSVKSTDEVLN